MQERRFSIFYLTNSNPAAVSLMESVWHKALHEKLQDRIFHDGTVKTVDEFVAEILRPGSLPFVVLCNGEIAACSWLNCITNRTARTHFVIFRDYWGKDLHKNIGQNTYAYILTRKDKMGYLFDCLYGVTPKSNPLAWKAALDCGWQRVGELPNGCYMAGKGRSEPGIITCATREILGIEEGSNRSALWVF